jgi:hypothetical protein
MSGPALIFDFSFSYPTYRSCQRQSYIDNMLDEVYKQFASVTTLSLELGNESTKLRLCSIGVLTYSSNYIIVYFNIVRIYFPFSFFCRL